MTAKTIVYNIYSHNFLPVLYRGTTLLRVGKTSARPPTAGMQNTSMDNRKGNNGNEVAGT